MKSWLPPIAALVLVLTFSLWNSNTVSGDTARWREQLQQADTLAQAEDWPGAVSALTKSYQDWSTRQTYLHIVSQHGAVDDAETLYRRCMAYAATQEITEFRAELSDLRDQLRLLAEMERLSVKNIL